MQRDVLIENHHGRTRVAVLEDGELKELYSEQAGLSKLTGNIYMGRCQNVLPGMQAAFIDIGLEKNAFLYAGDLTPGPDCSFDGNAPRPEQIPIQKMVRPGQELLVQVTKEPGGSKGVRVSTHITLPGRIVVLLPTVEYVGVSRKLSEPVRSELRSRINRLRPEGMGIIARTAAAEATDEELTYEIEALAAIWSDIDAHARHATAPRLIRSDETLLMRSVRESISTAGTLIRIEGEDDYKAALEMTRRTCPQFIDRLALHTSKMPLFRLYRVDEQAKKALARRVWLKSGAYLVIDNTEAMTVIDVNSGKFTGVDKFGDTVRRVNLEAAEMIATQLRLRNVGGIIVIDFIDMASDEDRAAVLTALSDALKADRAKTAIFGFTQLGMLEMTRKKPQHTLQQQYTVICRHCDGEGSVLSGDALARMALDDILERDALSGASPVAIYAAPHVYKALQGLKIRRNKPVMCHSDPTEREYRIEALPEEG